MNHIYKTIFNKITGKISVVSEKTTNAYQSEKGKTSSASGSEITYEDNHRNESLYKTKYGILPLSIALILSTFSVSNVLAETYNGDVNTLKNSSNIVGNLNNLIVRNNVSGIIATDASGNPLDSGVTTNINYIQGSAPGFVISGYNFVNWDQSSESINTSNNIVNLMQGNINENVYSGAAHSSQTIASLDCSTSGSNCINTSVYKNLDNKTLQANNNKVHVSQSNNNLNVQGDIYSGYTGFNFVVEDQKAGISDGNDSPDSRIQTSVSASFLANENQVLIDNNEGVFNNISAGYAGISFNTGNLTAGSDNIPVNNEGNYPIAQTLVLIGTTDQIVTLDANKNIIMVNGKNNKVSDINSGYTNVSLLAGNQNAGTSEKDMSLTIDNRIEGWADVRLEAQGLTTNANDNKVLINNEGNQFANINVGSGNLIMESLDVNGGSVNIDNSYNSSIKVDASNMSTNSTIQNTNNNEVLINSGKNTFNDINVGNSSIKIKTGNITAGDITLSQSAPNTRLEAPAFVEQFITSKLTAENNKAIINANNNSFNNINVGNAEINIDVGTISAGIVKAPNNPTNLYVNSSAYIDISNTKLNANNNEIYIEGENNKVSDIISGSAKLNINIGDIKGGQALINNILVNSSTTDASLDLNLENYQASASNNKIDLKGSSAVSGNVYTGYIDFNINHGSVENANGTEGEINTSFVGTEAFAKNNVINIEGSHKFTNSDSTIYGGYLNYNKDKGYLPESYDIFTGNTLNYSNSEAIKIKEIGNFQTYNFSLNPELANTGIAMIQANNILLGATPDNISDGSTTASDINVIGIQAGRTLFGGDKIIMLKATDSLVGLGESDDVDGVSQPSTTVAQQGISLKYDVKTDVDYANKEVTATILNNQPTVNPQLKPLLEGNLSGLMLLTRGADQLEGLDDQHKRGLYPFVIASGQHSRYNSGSNIKSDSGLFTVGFSVYDDKTTWGMFIENGWDSYKTHNSFNHAADVNGKGHNRFNGYGVFANYQFDNNWYLDGTLRAGRLKTAFETSDLRNLATGEIASYDIKGNYYGAILKGGRDWAWNDRNTVDLSAKYSWVGTESHNLTVAGDPIHFDALNSHRILLNAENNYQFNPELSFISGLGYEQELAGKAKGTTYGIYDIDEASVKGGTGIITAGLHYEPSQYKRLSIDLKGSGYFGKREGGSALLKVDYKF